MSQDASQMKQDILDLSEKIFNRMPVLIPPEWFSSDLTVAQLRILLLLHKHGTARMGAIASGLNITLPTATGIVDKLVKKDMVDRETDEQDRRLVICKLSEQGQMLINMIWVISQSQMGNLLEGLPMEQLEKCLEVANILYNNASRKNPPENEEVA